MAALALVPFALEALTWVLPAGLAVQAPGAAVWGLALLLAAANEELFSRGLILERLARAYRPGIAVAVTAALFGLQHLSALALTSRGSADVLGNVLASGVYGFALAAFQLRFRWLWPLILLHAAANFLTIHAPTALPDPVIVVTHAGLLGYGVLLLHRTRAGPAGDRHRVIRS